MGLMNFLRRRWVTLTIILVSVVVIWNSYHIRQEQNKGRTRDGQLANEESKTKQLVIKNNKLAKTNRQLIQQIQNSRLNSCKDTYKVIQTILKQSAKGVQLKDGRAIRFQQLLDLSNPKRCVKQTAPKRSSD